jgi:hypothetical protein
MVRDSCGSWRANGDCEGARQTNQRRVMNAAEIGARRSDLQRTSRESTTKFAAVGGKPGEVLGGPVGGRRWSQQRQGFVEARSEERTVCGTMKEIVESRISYSVDCIQYMWAAGTAHEQVHRQQQPLNTR